MSARLLSSVSRCATAVRPFLCSHCPPIYDMQPLWLHKNSGKQRRHWASAAGGWEPAAGAPPSSSAASSAQPPGDDEPGSVCSQRAAIHDVPGSLAEEVAEVLLAYGAQTASIEEHRPEGAPEQVAPRAAAGLPLMQRLAQRRPGPRAAS